MAAVIGKIVQKRSNQTATGRQASRNGHRRDRGTRLHLGTMNSWPRSSISSKICEVKLRYPFYRGLREDLRGDACDARRRREFGDRLLCPFDGDGHLSDRRQ